MTVSIKDLTKIYGNQTAVDHISFSVQKGEILGFLGPNGAGKSTTMKMAACFLTPTAGSISICGYDVVTESLAVREKVGYLPENNPLYPDLYVKEYLELLASIHKIKERRERIKEMIHVTGLEPEQGKKIGQLSKGYRQRVGLAQTLIHDPEVLIMDEPTSGLDPNQIVEIRELIQNISHEKTVILSTHIMQEVQAICSRVIIIDHGKLIADSPINELLVSGTGKKHIRMEFSIPPEMEIFKNIPGIEKIEFMGETIIRITVHGDMDPRAEIFRIAAENNLPLIGLTQEESSMEKIFQELTNIRA